MNRGQEEERKICEELAEIGIKVYSIYELTNPKKSNAAAFPILLRWLPVARSDRNREGIVRSLDFPEAGREALHVLLEQFEALKTHNQSRKDLKWVMGKVIGHLADSRDTPEILQLVDDDRHGAARQCLVDWLGNQTLDENGIDVLERRLGDGDLMLHALTALASACGTRGLDIVKSQQNHDDKIIRRHVRRILESRNERE